MPLHQLGRGAGSLAQSKRLLCFEYCVGDNFHVLEHAVKPVANNFQKDLPLWACRRRR